MKKKKHNLSYNFLLKIIYFLQIIKIYKFTCDKKSPFLKEGTCVTSCPIEEFNKSCILENEIIKTQWINNIIYLTDIVFPYINMVTTENEDLLILVSEFPGSNKRVLYGLTKEGRGYFKVNGKETKDYLIEINDEKIKARYESELFTFKLSNGHDDKEYLMNFGKTYFIEIYDLNTKEVYFHNYSNYFYELIDVHHIIGGHVKLSDDNSYLIGILSYIYPSPNFNKTEQLSLIKFRINSLQDVSKNNYKKKEINNYESKIISCYETTTKYIICFYKNIDNKYTMGAFSSELEEKSSCTIADADENENKFFKCVHFDEEIGAFIYFSNDNQPTPILKFIKYCYASNSITEVLRYISIKDYQFSYNLTSNDMIKAFDKKIYYAAFSLDQKELLLTSIYNYEQGYIIHNTYIINSFSYKNYQFYDTIRLNIYNNFLAFGSNGYSGILKGVISTLIIFSYPNSSDINNELSDYLFKNNDIKIDNIILEPKKLCIIENNIFGHILTGIKIIEIYKTTNEYLSLSNGNEIKKDTVVGLNENLKLIIPKLGNIYNKFVYGIKYVCQATEPEYEDYNKYQESVVDTGLSYDFSYSNYYQKKEYNGRYSYYNISLNYTLTEENCSDSCELCYVVNKNKCVTCKYEFHALYNYKICCEEITNINSETNNRNSIMSDTINSKENNYKEIKIIDGVCREELLDEMAEETYLYIKNELINSNISNDNLIIRTSNVTFQLTTVNYQNKYNNLSISSINLGECQDKLKKENNISEEYDLIILKVDIQNQNKSLTYVQYEIYNPITFKKLSLEVCQNLIINITIPINIDSETSLLYDNLDDYGYNLFNLNDIFYNDICTPYTTMNDTDILLIDRKTDIYNKYGNIYICQNNCDFESYNSNYKKATCFCNVQSNNISIDLDILSNFNLKDLNDIIFNYLNISNFRVLKCYKFAFDFSTIFTNYGRLIMTFILLGFTAIFIIFLVKGKNQIKLYFTNILNNKFTTNLNKNEIKYKNHLNLKKINNEKNKKKTNDKKKDKINKNNKEKIKPNPIKNVKNLITKNDKEKGNSENNKKKQIKTNSSINDNLSKEKILINRNNSNNNIYRKKNNNNIINNNIFDSNIISKFKDQKDIKKSNSLNKKTLNDEELNTLDYDDALILDKRTFFEYYLSLIKKRQLLLFAFLSVQDYNLQYIKISFLILSFSLSFSINGFFFNDETMHKIYINNGLVNYLYQIQQILYSSIISSVINKLLKFLSLTEKEILELKKIDSKRKFLKEITNLEKQIKIKFSIFFVICYLLLFFFWYFISCFCGIYKNTQLILISDTLISFGLSMIYPFGLNIFAGLFRMPALGAKNKDKKCLYKTSRIVEIIF